MKDKKNVSIVVSNQMCTGCGVCEDVCPKRCITITRLDGEHKPVVDGTSCLGERCGKCLKVCPGIGTPLAAISKELFNCDNVLEDKYIGRYVSLHTGYSLDEDIRYHSASGGMVSQFLIYLLEKKIIDGAVVTGFDKDYLTPYSYIARTREDVIKARSSKYCPVALNKVGNEIVDSEGKYVIVGLPCHIQGFRKRMKIDKKLRDRVIGLFSIYCSSGRTFHAQDYLLRHYHIDRKNVSYFAFRDHGCLGYLTIEENGATAPENRSVGARSTDCTELKIPYSQYYGPILRSFFKPHRCLLCVDHYGELADVSFGDIHIKPYSDDTIGVSSWITRNAFWENQFCQASEKGYIKMDDLDAETLNQSQRAMLYPKKRRARAVMRMDRLIGRANPKYDKVLENPELKDYIAEIVCFCQQFIGRRKSLWFIIKILGRRRK